PISTYLKLPAPLDAVLFALENDAEGHQIPLAFDVTDGNVSAGQIAVAATTALGKLIANALAAAPMRAAGMVTGLLGPTGGAAEPVEPISIEFAPGDASLPPSADDALRAALGRLADLDAGVIVVAHDLGAGDEER